MGIEDDFYSTIKLKNGEEIFAKVSASEEEDRTLLIISHPIVMDEIVIRGNTAGYKFEPWLKTSKEDMLILNMSDVLTIVESNNIEMILMYEEFVRKINKDVCSKPTKEMGYLGNVSETKKSLENLFNNS
jgi:hypothetical protein